MASGKPTKNIPFGLVVIACLSIVAVTAALSYVYPSGIGYLSIPSDIASLALGIFLGIQIWKYQGLRGSLGKIALAAGFGITGLSAAGAFFESVAVYAGFPDTLSSKCTTYSSGIKYCTGVTTQIVAQMFFSAFIILLMIAIGFLFAARRNRSW